MRALSYLLPFVTLAFFACSDDAAPSPADTSLGDTDTTPDPPLPTADLTLAGHVLSEDLRPIPTATVTLGDHRTTTDAAGHFSLPIPDPPPATLRVEAAGFTPTHRALPPLTEAATPAGHIILSAITASQHIPITGGALSAAHIHITIAPNTFPRPATVTITDLPFGDLLLDPLRLPSALPAPPDALTTPILGFQLNAEGLQPAEPIEIRYTPSLPLPPGTEVPIGRFDPLTGTWRDAALATADTSGALISTLNHLSTFVGALPSLPPSSAHLPELSDLQQPPQLFAPGEPRFDPRSGALQVGFDTPAITRNNRDFSLTLFHDSRTVSPRLVAPLALPNDSGSSPLVLSATLGSQSFRAQAELSSPASPSTPQALLPAFPLQRATPPRIRAHLSLQRATPNATVHQAAYRSFTGLANPDGAGPSIRSGGTPITTAATQSTHKSTTLTFDDRRQSPFGSGWHLAGLTRLHAPSCSTTQATLVGGYDIPVLLFGAQPEYLLHPPELTGLNWPRHSVPQLAWSQDALYIGIPPGDNRDSATIWRQRAGQAPEKMVGHQGAGATSHCTDDGTPLHIQRLAGMGPAPGGDGITFATESCVYHLDAHGELVLLAGSTAETAPGPQTGVAATEANFSGELVRYFADPTGRSAFLVSYAHGPFILDGYTLSRPRLEVTADSELIGAFNPEGTFVYTHPDSDCIYTYNADGPDRALFPRCQEGPPSHPTDGLSHEATIGRIGAMSFDDEGLLWLHDATFTHLRRRGIEGSLETIIGGDMGQLYGMGGPASRASLGDAHYHIATRGDEQVALASAEHIFQLLPDDTPRLAPLRAGDRSTLSHAPDGTWLRTLFNDSFERYGPDGLLQERGEPGAIPLRYHYAPWPVAPSAHECGVLLAPPLLESITLGDKPLYTFDWNHGLLRSIRDAAGREITFEHRDGLLQRLAPPESSLTFNYDAGGLITERTTPGPNHNRLTWKYTYDAGHLTAAEIPGRGTLAFSPAEKGFPVYGDAHPSGIARSIQAHPPHASLETWRGGTLDLLVGADRLTLRTTTGAETTLVSDAQGRVIREERPDGSVLSFERDRAGRLLRLKNETTGDTFSYHYNPLDQLTARTDPAGAQSSFSYDSAGRLSQRFDPSGKRFQVNWHGSGAAEGLPQSSQDGAGLVTEYRYDEDGNLVEILAPGGLTTRYERDKVGRVTRVLGPDGLSLTSDYDARNNLTRRQRGGAQGPAISHSWAAADGWEGVGSSIPGSILQKTTDELGREWRDIYDDAFRRTREGHPTAGDTRYEYDALGRIVMRIAPGMGTEVIDWDAQGRIARRTYQGAAATVFRYDDHGRVLGVQDGLVHETRTYGPGMGLTSVQLAARTGFPEAAGFLLTRQTPRFDEELWRLEDREARITRAFDGRVLGLDLRSLIGNSQAQRYIEYAWDGARRMSSATYINGVTAEYDYHSATGLPRSVRLSGPHNTLELSVTYDEAGRPSALLDSEDQLSFEYDDDGRIAACGLERYTWDVTGARLSKGPNTYEREASGHLVDDGENTYTWDLAGRQAARNGEAPRTYIYGLDGLLKEVKEGELLLARFDYDAFGRRISKTTQAGRWLYGYMPDSDRLVRVVAPDQRIWHLYYTTSHSVFSLARRDDGFTQFVHLDPIGRVAAVSTSNGELHDLRGDCFGNRPESHPNLGIDIGFHGMLWDAETGLYYAGGRYYDPAIGEFLTPDPLGLVGGTAPYTYAAGNPIMMADPQGRLLFPFLGAVVAGGVIFKAIRDLTQSADTKRARRSYEDIALAVDLEDHHLDSAALAHKRLSKQAERGGEVAASGVAGFVGAAANPTQSAKQLIIEMSKETARAAAESFRSEGEEGEDED